MMRKLLFSAAAAASAIALGSPAFAQAGPQHHGYSAPPGYGAPAYGYGRGLQGQVRQLHRQVEQLRARINQLHRMNRLSNREARRLDAHAVQLHQRIDAAAFRGINRRQQAEIQYRVEGLRHAISYQAREGNRWGWGGYDRSDNAFGYYGERHRDDGRRVGRDDDDDDDRGRRRRD
jgi:TolA-binding protein